MTSHNAESKQSSKSESTVRTHHESPHPLLEFPVDALTPNIIHELERAALRSNYPMHKAVSDGLVSPEISYDIDGLPPRPPFADLDTRTIHVHQSFAAYLWSWSYSSFVLYEEYIQKPQLEGYVPRMNDLLRGAEALGDWALRIPARMEPWHAHFPSPQNEGDATQQSFVRKANALFLQATTYLLLHEYAHLTLAHRDDRRGSWMLEQETDADNFARTFLIDNSSSEQQRLIAGMSILLVNTACLFLSADFMGIWKRYHPHAVDRIRHAMSGLNLETHKSKDYLYLLAGMHLRRFLDTRNISVPLEIVDTPEDFFFFLLNRCDDVRDRSAM